MAHHARVAEPVRAFLREHLGWWRAVAWVYGARMFDEYAQDGARVRVGWGLRGLQALAPHATAVVVVDVLSFCTAVAVAEEAGAEVIPWRGVGAWAAEAVAARAAFEAHRADLLGALSATASGRELRLRGFAQDVALAAGGER